LASDESVLDQAKPLLVKELGPVLEDVGPLSFHFTSYYDAELGKGIKRWFWVFRDLVERSILSDVKCLTNSIEQTYTVDGKRRFNLDPGLLTLGNFVLATGKNNAHRIYLKEGIFADLTLIYRSGTYTPLEWTYPDYAAEETIEILNRFREHYKCTLAELTSQQAVSKA
jgi:hypothetical protein